MNTPKKNNIADGYYKDKQLELSREIQIFGDVTKRHIAEVHEKLSYLKSQIMFGAVEEKRDEFIQRLNTLKELSKDIYQYKDKNPDTELSDWEIAIEIMGTVKTTEMQAYLTIINDLTDYCRPEGKVTIWLNSGGGSIIDGLALIDMIDTFDIPVEIIATGEVQSMGIPILAAGTKGHRCATANTVFMMHEGCSGIYGGPPELERGAEFLKMLEKKVKKIVVKRTKLKAREYDKLNVHLPYYFDAKEALEIGLIDQII